MTQTSTRRNCKGTVKFLYSYNGQIVPRRSDGCLRYVGGYTRVLSVDRSITMAELMIKFGELCGSSKRLKCKLPNEDLDMLVSIKSDEELRSIIEEYDRVTALTNQEMKIRAILFPVTSLKKVSPPSSPMCDLAGRNFQPSRFSAIRHSPSQPSLASDIRRSPSQPSLASDIRRSPSQPSLASYRCCSPPAKVYPPVARRDAVRTFCCRHESPRNLYCASAYPNYLH